MSATIDLSEHRAKLREICDRYQVSRLSVFGSVARGQARPDSDVDLLVEFLPEARIGMIQFGGLLLALSELMGRKVDLVTNRALRPALRESILEEAQLLYAA
jgi:predicted nucleotidyltransferase